MTEMLPMYFYPAPNSFGCTVNDDKKVSYSNPYFCSPSSRTECDNWNQNFSIRRISTGSYDESNTMETGVVQRGGGIHHDTIDHNNTKHHSIVIPYTNEVICSLLNDDEESLKLQRNTYIAMFYNDICLTPWWSIR